MKTLSRTEFEKAVSFLHRHARPLEQALYAYHFEGAPAARALDELARFQNGDGGFGHGLEPDIRLDDSSVIATTIAFQRLRELRAPADHPLVVGGCRYLRDTYDAQGINWPIIPPNIDDAPHAPWWVHGGSLEKSRANPRAEIAGYVNEYVGNFPAAMREQVTRSVVDDLLSREDRVEMHDLLCYLRLWDTHNLSGDIRAEMQDKLRRVVEATVERRPAQWREYGLPPLGVIASPESAFADLFRDEIAQNLDFLIESRNENGVWGPNWSWGDQWPEDWAQAERDWTGVLTLDNLRKLRAFGRIG